MLKGRLEILTGSRVKRIFISGTILGIFPSSCLFSVTINSSDDIIAHAHGISVQGARRAASREQTEFKIHRNML